jgi:hypothetical protein
MSGGFPTTPGWGYAAALHEVPDAHNFTARRDAFDPHLTRLLAQVCE